MTALSMTIAPEGERRLLQECPGIHIEAATRAGLNDIGYIDRIAHATQGSFSQVTPKDWGDEMWGMKKDTPPKEMLKQINQFMREFEETFRGFVTKQELSRLKAHYEEKYLAGAY